MIDITHDLRIFRDLLPIWKNYETRSSLEYFLAKDAKETKANQPMLKTLRQRLMEEDWRNYPTADDSRVQLFMSLRKELGHIAMESAMVRITDPALVGVFHKLRAEAFADDETKRSLADEFFEKVLDRHHPSEIVERLKEAKAWGTQVSVPHEVELLITEARNAYGLGLPIACVAVCWQLIERVLMNLIIRCGWIDDRDRLDEMSVEEKIMLLPDGRKAPSSFMRQAITSQLEAIDSGLSFPKKADLESALGIYQGTLSLIGSLYSQYSNPQVH
jgi:hypothetical protein